MIIHRPPFIIHHFTSLSSTNDQLKAMAAAPEFTCVVADEQTAGRGRRARTWYSAPGDGLYLSILFLPRSDSSSRLPLTGLLAAVAVAETLIERGVAGVDIKWPNDALAGGRKNQRRPRRGRERGTGIAAARSRRRGKSQSSIIPARTERIGDVARDRDRRASHCRRVSRPAARKDRAMV